MLAQTVRLAAAGLFLATSMAPSIAMTKERLPAHHRVHHHYAYHRLPAPAARPYAEGGPYWPDGANAPGPSRTYRDQFFARSPYTEAPAGSPPCVQQCEFDMSPCDPPYLKQADGRCNPAEP